MFSYTLKRILYAFPIIIGVLVITFILFFYISTPDKIARQIVGEKAPQAAIDSWIEQHQLNKPYYINTKERGFSMITETLFFDHIYSLLSFNFGNSYTDDQPIINKIKTRAIPSLIITLPLFIFGLIISISLALFFSFLQNTYIDKAGTFLSVLLMSISVLIYIIFFQWLLSSMWHLFPVSGWSDGWHRINFIIMPLIIGTIGALGGGVRFYRTIMLEETTKDYVRTARAKGVKESVILFKHILKNAMIPILTNTVMQIPYLFVGSLILESFFGIPGLGSFTIIAFQNSDFQSLKVMVFFGAILFQIGIIMTDISYTLVDPRVVFK